jgi:hypothetical protein
MAREEVMTPLRGWIKPLGHHLLKECNVHSRELCRSMVEPSSWCHLEGGLSSREALLSCGGREWDSGGSGPMRSRVRCHPSETSGKITMSILSPFTMLVLEYVRVCDPHQPRPW